MHILLSTSTTNIKCVLVGALYLLLSVGCSLLPNSGPSTGQITKPSPDAYKVAVVDMSDEVMAQFKSHKQQTSLRYVFNDTFKTHSTISAGDTLSILLWESPPSVLFGSHNPNGFSAVSELNLPSIIVNSNGVISIPFVGELKAAGKTPQALQTEIVRRLAGKANQPQALVNLSTSDAQAVTIMGEVEKSQRMPLTAKRERLLDALAASGGGKGRIDKLSVVFSRNNNSVTVPLGQLIKDPSQNITLQAGDVITVSSVNSKLTVLGAIGKNSQLEFGADGLSLVQALAQSDGLIDSRANPKGVFVFRQLPPKADTNPSKPQPTVYRFDFSQPHQFFYAKDFHMQDGDILFVSNSATTGLSKFLQMLTQSLTSIRIIQGL